MMTNSPTKSSQPFRLAFRVEGAFWNAYLALAHTMDESLLLGSIRMVSVDDPALKERFMDLMKEVMAAAIMDAAGLETKWPDPPHAAPEHERSGSA